MRILENEQQEEKKAFSPENTLCDELHLAQCYLCHCSEEKGKYEHRIGFGQSKMFLEKIRKNALGKKIKQEKHRHNK